MVSSAQLFFRKFGTSGSGIFFNYISIKTILEQSKDLEKTSSIFYWKTNMYIDYRKKMNLGA